MTQKHTLQEFLYLMLITRKNEIVPKYPHACKRDIDYYTKGPQTKHAF